MSRGGEGRRVGGGDQSDELLDCFMVHNDLVAYGRGNDFASWSQYNGEPWVVVGLAGERDATGRRERVALPLAAAFAPAREGLGTARRGVALRPRLAVGSDAFASVPDGNEGKRARERLAR